MIIHYLLLCDQIYDWNPSSFLNFVQIMIMMVLITEKKNTPTYSYIKLDDNNLGIELAEKKIISEDALIGMHYWKKGSDFIMSVKDLINKDIRTNNEYYLSLTYNILIEKGLKISNYNLKENEIYDVVGTFKY